MNLPEVLRGVLAVLRLYHLSICFYPYLHATLAEKLNRKSKLLMDATNGKYDSLNLNLLTFLQGQFPSESYFNEP